MIYLSILKSLNLRLRKHDNCKNNNLKRRCHEFVEGVSNIGEVKGGRQRSGKEVISGRKLKGKANFNFKKK